MSLYNKYRPQVFSDVVSHDVVMTALQSKLKDNRVSHAYIMTGQRGTGKTTTAKLLSKYLVCHSPKKGEPCNACEACIKAIKGIHEDIYEIDGASNNSVDDVREIIKALSYPAIAGKYKIYIIDEVHMLSNAAFNAMLTTIESPPKHVIFIFATTELHKIPATIRSRCQIFTFNQIEQKLIADRLMHISRIELINLDSSGAMAIARNAEGSLRDALSILEQLSHNAAVTVSEVNEALGLIDETHTLKFIDALVDKDTKACMTIYQDIMKLGKSPQQLMESVIQEASQFIMTGYRVEVYAEILKNILKFRSEVSKEVNVQLLFNLFIIEQTSTTQETSYEPIVSGSSNELEKRVKKIEDYLKQRSENSRVVTEVSSSTPATEKVNQATVPEKVQKSEETKPVIEVKTESVTTQTVKSEADASGGKTPQQVQNVKAIDDILSKLAKL